MGVSFNGISSGIDTASLIKAALDAQRVPVTQLNSRKTSFNAQISGIGQIASKLAELETMAKDMADTSNVLAFDVRTGDDTVLGAKAAGEASEANYDVEVLQLARAEKDRSAAFGSNFSEVKAGKLVIATAGDSASYEITIDQGDRLSTVVDKINASGAGVRASIVRDGTASYLQVVANDSGHVIGGSADDAISLTETSTGTTGQALGLTQVVTAQNAKLNVDGLAVESRSNQPDDVIAGMDLDLKKVGSSTLTVAPDKAGTKDKLSAFVEKANAVLDLVKASTRTSDGARAQNPDSAVERLGTEVRRLVLGTIEGVSGGTSSLTQVGIGTDAAGRLTIDSKKLDKALAGNMNGVSRLFTTPTTGLSAALESLVERYTSSVDGILGGRTKALTKRVDQLDSQIGRMEERIDRMGISLQRQFTTMEKALQTYQNQGNALASLYTSS